jgi:hypothetical protein
MHHRSLRDLLLLSLEFELARVAFYTEAIRSLHSAHHRAEWCEDLRHAEQMVARLRHRCREIDVDPAIPVRGRDLVHSAGSRLLTTLRESDHTHVATEPSAAAAGDWQLHTG